MITLWFVGAYLSTTPPWKHLGAGHGLLGYLVVTAFHAAFLGLIAWFVRRDKLPDEDRGLSYLSIEDDGEDDCEETQDLTADSPMPKRYVYDHISDEGLSELGCTRRECEMTAALMEAEAFVRLLAHYGDSGAVVDFNNDEAREQAQRGRLLLDEIQALISGFPATLTLFARDSDDDTP